MPINKPLPGSMEMDLVAHCGEINRGSYIHSLVLTDIASGWTEAAPIVVREGTLVVETLERIRVGLPFALRALDVDNGSEFVNNRLIDYCLSHGIELTRSRPYRKNDQAWIEQKNGAVVRKLLGYRRFEGLAAARAITRLCAGLSGSTGQRRNTAADNIRTAQLGSVRSKPLERLACMSTVSDHFPQGGG
jgi:Integrase core domain